MSELLFGTAGIPKQAASTLEGIKLIKKLGLGCMELEFVRGVRMKSELAHEVKKTAESEKIILTAHAPYYINLNSAERSKIEASKKYVIDTANISSICKAVSIAFHAGYYGKDSRDTAYKNIKEHLCEIMKSLNTVKDLPLISPEISGKPSQFGSLEEILQLSMELKGVMPCMDFSHYHARTGVNNSYKEFADALNKIKNKLGDSALQNMHIHISGIEYTDKGERKHLNLKESDLNYRDLMKALKDFNAAGVVICESPNLEEDALLLKKEYKLL